MKNLFSRYSLGLILMISTTLCAFCRCSGLHGPVLKTYVLITLLTTDKSITYINIIYSVDMFIDSTGTPTLSVCGLLILTLAESLLSLSKCFREEQHDFTAPLSSPLPLPWFPYPLSFSPYLQCSSPLLSSPVHQRPSGPDAVGEHVVSSEGSAVWMLQGAGVTSQLLW